MYEFSFLKMLLIFLVLLTLFDLRSSKIIDETTWDASNPLKTSIKRHKQTLVQEESAATSSDPVVRACNANSDCLKDECCLQKPWSNKFFCARRIREGKVCWSRPHNATDTWDKYRVICPCIAKHECRFQDPIFVLKPILAASTCQLKADDKMK